MIFLLKKKPERISSKSNVEQIVKCRLSEKER